MKKIITLLFSASILSVSAQCVMTGNAIPGPCSPTTNTYSVTGFVGYFNPPTTGTLTITSSCGGTPVVISAPFTGSTASYTIPGITADGASCTVMFSFSDLPTCMYTAMYIAPVACGTGSCVATAIANPSVCNPATNLYNVSGTVMYINPPSTGTLEVVGSCGGSQSFSPPFSGSNSYSLTGLNSDGVGCTVTCYFTALTSCNYAAMYTAPVACMTTSVSDNTFLTDLNISPNPTSGSINVSFNQSAVQSTNIEIIDVLGKSIYTLSLPKFTGLYSQKVDLTTFNKGIYFVKISGENGSEIRKIIYH